MVVQDSDGILHLDDVEEGEPLRRVAGLESPRAGVDALVGRPLSEVELYYMQRALELTGGNREEAARILGIGERTLYRMMQDARLREQVRTAMAETGNDVLAAAAKLGLSPTTLMRKLKKLGWRFETPELKEGAAARPGNEG
jgi:two-component system response regulator HydG